MDYNIETVQKLIKLNEGKIEEFKVHIGLLENRKEGRTDEEIAELDTSISAKKKQIEEFQDFSKELEALL